MFPLLVLAIFFKLYLAIFVLASGSSKMFGLELQTNIAIISHGVI